MVTNNWKKCPGYEGHECGKEIANYFNHCQECNFHFKVEAEERAELDEKIKKDDMKYDELKEDREFMLDKIALGTLSN